MGDITNNFSRHEFACKCGCGFEAVDHELVEVLQEAVDWFAAEKNQKMVAIITSANRCPEHNQREGGAKESKHIKGIAVDWLLRGVPVEELYDYLNERYPDQYGLKLYPTWVHFDVRRQKWRG